jgi:hypothetical protein
VVGRSGPDRRAAGSGGAGRPRTAAGARTDCMRCGNGWESCHHSHRVMTVPETEREVANEMLG